MTRFTLTVLLILATQGCAVLHRVSYGEFDVPPGFVAKPFEIRISQLGLDVGRIDSEVRAARLLRGKEDRPAGLATIIALFQFGPRTGNPVYDAKWGRNVFETLYERCPSGRITGLMSLRENREVSGVSGEYITVRGLCLLPQKDGAT